MKFQSTESMWNYRAGTVDDQLLVAEEFISNTTIICRSPPNDLVNPYPNLCVLPEKEDTQKKNARKIRHACMCYHAGDIK
jgi:hypothetical protein